MAILDFSNPKIMGVINLTPDSFSAVGRYHQNPEQALSYAQQLIAEGADILDLGAEPTNPGLHPCVSLQEELDRLIPALELIAKETDIPVSIDTSKPEVMTEALKHGVSIINDVRALRREGALEAIADSNAMVCLMHMSYPEGKPEHIQYEEFKPDVMTVVIDFLKERVEVCEAAGIVRERIILDPGLGFGNFGKNTKDNLEILKHLSQLRALNFPILIGASRKTFIGELVKKPVEERLAGSLAIAALAVYNGAKIIRTHDVKETKDAVIIASEMLHEQ
jgi:dihydropteroate synthase